MYETRQLHYCSDATENEEESNPELVIEVGDTHFFVTIEQFGRDVVSIRIPNEEAVQFTERLSSFIRGEVTRIAKEIAE